MYTVCPTLQNCTMTRPRIMQYDDDCKRELAKWRQKSNLANATMTWEKKAELCKRGKIRVSVPRERGNCTLEYVFRAEMTFWRDMVNCPATSEPLFTKVTWDLVERVIKWIEDGEDCDPEPIAKMYINLGTESEPKYICRKKMRTEPFDA